MLQPDVHQIQLLQNEVKTLYDTTLYGGGVGAIIIVLQNIFFLLRTWMINKNGNGNGKIEEIVGLKKDIEHLDKTIDDKFDDIIKQLDKRDVELSVKFQTLSRLEGYLGIMKILREDHKETEEMVRNHEVSISTMQRLCDERYKKNK